MVTWWPRATIASVTRNSVLMCEPVEGGCITYVAIELLEGLVCVEQSDMVAFAGHKFLSGRIDLLTLGQNKTGE